MIDEKYTRVVEVSVNGIEAIRRSGIEVVECRDGHAKLRMPLAGNTNHVGMMYAGPLFTLGEVSGGAAFLVAMDYNKFFPIVKSVNIRFLKPAVSDVTLEVEMDGGEAARVQGEAEEKGKADFDLDLEIKDSTDTVVALVSGRWQIRPTPPGMTMPWS